MSGLIYEGVFLIFALMLPVIGLWTALSDVIEDISRYDGVVISIGKIFWWSVLFYIWYLITPHLIDYYSRVLAHVNGA